MSGWEWSMSDKDNPFKEKNVFKSTSSMGE